MSSSRLWTFHGGLHLEPDKQASTRHPVVRARLPKQLILPLQQHIGQAAKPLLKVGESVNKGQVLAQADGYISAPLHAPSSGTVVAIEERPVAHPSGLSALCFILETDGQEQWCELPPPLADYQAVDPAELRQRIRESGIVGLGGAAFPSAVKLNPGPHVRINQLILNGAECEPSITCDDMLMRDQARQIIHGLLIMAHALQAKDAIIGIEQDKPEAIAALREALSEFGAEAERIRIQPIPVIYPTGGEKQLIQVLTGRQVPSHGLPAEIGIVCHNVATAAAVYQAVMHGRPLISRYTTIAGQGVQQAQVLEVLIGTPIQELIEQCGGYTHQFSRLIMGGPMMGYTLHSDQVPVVKSSNCILASNIPPPPPAMPCIRCGACAEVCPAQLLPQQLYWHARSREFDKTQDYHLFDCIECGCCSAVCPSRIPLVQYYRHAKTEIWAQEQEREKADLARQRHEFRLQRLEREKQERAERSRKKKEALNKTAGPDPKKAVIEAALARARAKKTETTVNTPVEQDE